MAQRKGSPTESHPLLLDAVIPDRITTRKPQEVILTFSPTVTDVRVNFEFATTNLRVSCDGQAGESHEFKFRFREDDPRTRTFRLWISDPTGSLKRDSTEHLSIICSEKNRQEVKDKFVDLILDSWLTSIPYVDGALNFLRTHLSWKVKIAVLVVAAIVALFAFKVIPAAPLLKPAKHFSVKRGWRPPDHYSQPKWEDHFNNAGEQPDPQKWGDAPPAWKLVPVKNDVSNKALLVSGTDVGLVSLQDEYQALYDCTVKFTIIVAENQRSASWIVRAKDKQSYYLFELDFPTTPTGGARLNGYIYEGGQRLPGTLSGNNKSLDYGPLHEGDRLHITIEIKGSEFKHTFLLINPMTAMPPDGRVRLQPGVNRGHGLAYERAFTDPRYAYGQFGFTAAGADGEMKVQRLEITTQ